MFYGDLYGCAGENPQEPVAQLEDIVRCRKLFAYGELRDYWDHRESGSPMTPDHAERAANCVAWARMGDEEHDASVTIICNGKDEGTKKVEVGKEHAGEKWTDVLGWQQGEITIGEGASARTHVSR